MTVVLLEFCFLFSDLCCRPQGLLQIPALLLVVQAALVIVVGDVTQEQGLLGDGEDSTLHR